MPKLPAPPLPSALKARAGSPRRGESKPTPLDHAADGRHLRVDWVDERTSLTGAARWLMFRKVPQGTNWFYTLGSATMFAFLSQAITGVFLAMYYRPDASGGAYESIRYVTNDVFLGQFVRGMHKWGASVMVILVFLHMGRTFFFGAYKYPRELNWVIGVVLLILTLVMSLHRLPAPVRSARLLGDDRRRQHQRHGSADRALSQRLPARRLGIRRDHAVAVLRDPHAARARGDHRADRRPPVPRHEARHDRSPLAESRDAGALREEAV